MHKDWAQVSSSESDDSSDVEKQETKQEPAPVVTEKQKEWKKWEQPQHIEYNKAKQDRRRQDNQDEKKQFKPKDFLTVEALTKQIENSKEQVKQLAIVFCFHLDQQEIKQKYSSVKTAKKYREGSYQITFENKEDLFKFLKQKEANKDKFFIKLSKPARQPRQPRQPRQHRQYQKPKRVYQQKQQKQSRQFHYQKKQVKHVANIFDQNKWVFDEKVTSSDVISSISGNKLFDSFENIRIVVNEAKDIETASKLAQTIANQLHLIKTKQSRNGREQFKLSKEVKKEVQVEGKQHKPAQSQSQSDNRKYREKRNYYIKDNKIRIIPSINFEQVLKEINKKQIFNYYGAIRIKATGEFLKIAKDLSNYICKELNCQQIKQEKVEDEYVLILSEKQQKKQVKNYLADNKIKVSKGINVKRTLDELRGKFKTIFNTFTTLKVQYPAGMEKQGKEICDQLTKLKLVKTGEESKKIEDVQVQVVTFKEQEGQPKLQPNKVEHKEKQIKHKPKYREIEAKQTKQSKSLFNLEKTNVLKIEEELNPQTVVTQFQKVRKQFLSFYKCLKISCSNPTLFKHTRQLGERLKAQKLRVKEIMKNTNNVETLVLQLEEEPKAPVKRKVQVSQVNDYLST